jgi:hypothetical protein
MSGGLDWGVGGVMVIRLVAGVLRGGLYGLMGRG